MEITYQPVLDKNYTKAVKKISRDIYKYNKFRKVMRLGDFLLYLFCLIPSLFIAFFMRNWAEVLYDYYENILAYYAGYILFAISMLSFFYALIIRPYLNMCMIKNQIGDKMEKGSQTIRIQEDGLYIKIDLCQTLYSYHYIHNIENKYGYLVIRVGSGLFLDIPYSAFQNDAHREAFESALQEKINAYQVEPLSK